MRYIPHPDMQTTPQEERQLDRASISEPLRSVPIDESPAPKTRSEASDRQLSDMGSTAESIFNTRNFAEAMFVDDRKSLEEIGNLAEQLATRIKELLQGESSEKKVTSTARQSNKPRNQR